MKQKLLTREDFRNKVFQRDNFTCVFCKATNVKFDAHHIIERRLFQGPEELGGYFIDNGITVCEDCHLKCEQTIFSVDEARIAANIKNIILPQQFYSDEKIDKWGNTILQNGMRLKGELFHDESVQKVLADSLHFFIDYVKYPRCFHVPWSPGVSSDDKIQYDLIGFKDQEVVISEKLDGENTTLYSNKIHARSFEYSPRIDRDMVKALHANIAHEIPDGWRICGENLWAEHSIRYENLPSTFFVFSIWNEKNECLSYDETKAYCDMLGLIMAPVLWRGKFDKKFIKDFTKSQYFKPNFSNEIEGYIVRVADSFRFVDFRKKLLKYVRAGHVQTQAHWTRIIKQNGFT